GPEPGDEEHHFGGDEQDHPVAVRDLHHARVMALVGGLARDVGPPADHRIGGAEDAEEKEPARPYEHMAHPGDAAHRPQERRDRADDRPGTGIHQVVVVVRLGMGVGHLSLLRYLKSAPGLAPPKRCGSGWRTGYMV